MLLPNRIEGINKLYETFIFLKKIEQWEKLGKQYFSSVATLRCLDFNPQNFLASIQQVPGVEIHTHLKVSKFEKHCCKTTLSKIIFKTPLQNKRNYKQRYRGQRNENKSGRKQCKNKKLLT